MSTRALKGPAAISQVEGRLYGNEQNVSGTMKIPGNCRLPQPSLLVLQEVFVFVFFRWCLVSTGCCKREISVKSALLLPLMPGVDAGWCEVQVEETRCDSRH